MKSEENTYGKTHFDVSGVRRLSLTLLSGQQSRPVSEQEPVLEAGNQICMRNRTRSPARVPWPVEWGCSQQTQDGKALEPRRGGPWVCGTVAISPCYRPGTARELLEAGCSHSGKHDLAAVMCIAPCACNHSREALLC